MKPEVKVEVEVPAQPPPVVEAKSAVFAQPVEKKPIIEPVKPAQSQQPVQQQEPARPATGIVKLADRIKMFQSVTQVAPVHNPVVVPKH